MFLFTLNLVIRLPLPLSEDILGESSQYVPAIHPWLSSWPERGRASPEILPTHQPVCL